jgi:hypothetical protein
MTAGILFSYTTISGTFLDTASVNGELTTPSRPIKTNVPFNFTQALKMCSESSDYRLHCIALSDLKSTLPSQHDSGLADRNNKSVFKC